jgi:hypothetical protein
MTPRWISIAPGCGPGVPHAVTIKANANANNTDAIRFMTSPLESLLLQDWLSDVPIERLAHQLPVGSGMLMPSF